MSEEAQALAAYEDSPYGAAEAATVGSDLVDVPASLEGSEETSSQSGWQQFVQKIRDRKANVDQGVRDVFEPVVDTITDMAHALGGDTGTTKKLWLPEMCLLGVVPVNIVEEQNPEHQADITEKVLEDGEPLSDHVHVKPYKVKVRGQWVSDKFLHHVYYHALRIIFEHGLAVPFLSNMALRKNMVIKHLSPVHKQGEANAFSFSCTLQQVNWATAGESEYEPGEDPVTGEGSEGSSDNGSGDPQNGNGGESTDASLLQTALDLVMDMFSSDETEGTESGGAEETE